ncbi:cytochrome P450 [Macrophomina phaseolina]|uniref:Cytochrome P450 n=1 Tax=Macrophomina phaseolina TaxID=35725 RepID=A0ABQ8GDZ0_9PEZI|nr:cytochrome P450 [Macrophomina phaseolina]
MAASLEAPAVSSLWLAALFLGPAVHVSSLGLRLDRHAWSVVRIGSSVILLSLLAFIPSLGVIASVQNVLLFAAAFLVSFFVSVAIYRLFFSPIRHFPGPWQAALTSFYRVFVSIGTNLRLFTKVEELHKQYGDYVRVGPREISILNPAAIPLLYGSKTRCKRGPWYDHISGEEEDKHVLAVTDPVTHSRWRKVLDRGLSSKALAAYEVRIQDTVDSFVEALASRAGSPINMTDWVNFFSFDAMGRISYSTDFGMLKRGEGTVEVDGRSTSLKVLHEAMKALGLLGPVPWLFRMIGQAGGGGEINTFFDWCYQAMQLKQRTFNAATDTPTDIASWILAGQHATPDPSKRQSQRSLENTSSLLILAGSDTAASAITNALFYLTRSPSVRAKLRAELDALPTPASLRSLASVRYLDHVINETLRLKPPAVEGLGRETPAEGLALPDGAPFIPGGTVVAVPTWALHRDARFWGADAGEFRPERFERVDLTGETLPFIPFTRGACTCPGKQLAYVEMRAVIAAVVRRFDWEFAEGQGAREFDEGCVDSFTLMNPPLMLVLSKRDG